MTKYAIFNIIPSYGETEFHFVKVFFSQYGGEIQEDRYKYTIKNCPEHLYRPERTDIEKDLAWLITNYKVTSTFIVLTLDGEVCYKQHIKK